MMINNLTYNTCTLDEASLWQPRAGAMPPVLLESDQHWSAALTVRAWRRRVVERARQALGGGGYTSDGASEHSEAVRAAGRRVHCAVGPLSL